MELISCILPTYNLPTRLEVLNEAVESFLRQDWPNKELIIIIDSPGQRIETDDTRIHVINSPIHFNTLGDKLNYAIRAAQGDLICRFDDDDISLPNRLTYQASQINERGLDYYTPGSLWTTYEERLFWKKQSGYGHSQGMFRRSAWADCRGYPALSGDEDAAMHGLMTKLRWKMGNETPLEAAQAGVLYRWSTGLSHISGMGSRDRMQMAYNQNAQLGEAGTYGLNPHWKHDYAQLLMTTPESGINWDE